MIIVQKNQRQMILLNLTFQCANDEDISRS